MQVKYFRYYPSLTSLFVLIYNCVVSGFLQEYIFDYVRIRFFVLRLDYVREQLYSHHCDFSFIIVTTTLSMLLLQQRIFNGVKITLFFVTFLVCHCEILCIMLQLHFSRFLKNLFLITLEIRCLLVRSNYLRKCHIITLRVEASFLGRQLFDSVYILIPWSALNMEIMLQSRFIFIHHRNEFFKTS